MIEVQEEKYVWEDLLHSVSKVLSEIGDGRAQVKETDSFDRAEWLMSDVYDFIEGRLQELDPTYSERKAWSPKARAQAKKALKKALSYGINYQAFKGVPYEETDRALKYIEARGLESMNYEATRKALREFRDDELRKRVNLG